MALMSMLEAVAEATDSRQPMARESNAVAIVVAAAVVDCMLKMVLAVFTALPL